MMIVVTILSHEWTNAFQHPEFGEQILAAARERVRDRLERMFTSSWPLRWEVKETE